LRNQTPKRRAQLKKKLTLTDKYIEILKYADQQDTFSLKELYSSVELSKATQDFVGQLARGGVIFYRNSRLSYKGKDVESFKITKDECFQLLEYRELKEARKSSKTATWFATGALLVSIVGFVFTILIHYKVL